MTEMDDKALAARLENAAAEITAQSRVCFEMGRVGQHDELRGKAAGVRLALSILNDGSGA